MTIWCTDIGPDANQKVHNVIMAPADGVVKGGDAFIVGAARVNHLRENRMYFSSKHKATAYGEIRLLQGSNGSVIQCKKFHVLPSPDVHAPLEQLSAPSPVHQPVLHLTPGRVG